MVDVFISYSREDVDKVGLLARKIEEEGYDVWWDADLPPHLSYGDVITTKIGMAKAAIVVWSKTSAASEWVRAEADMARNQKKLVQTSLDNVMPPLPFNQIQYAEIGNWTGETDHTGWTKVKASLSDLCGPPRKAEPTATPTPRPAAAVPAVTPMPASAPVAPVTNPEALSGPIPSVPGRTVPKGMLYAGIGVFAVVLALGAGMMLGGGGGGSDASEAEPAALAAPLAPATTAPGSVPAIAPEGAAAGAAPAAADELDRHVMVMNVSSQPLRELYASPVTSDNWEEDLLGTRVLGAGESISANIDNGTTECLFDMKAVMADDKEYIQQRVNVCEVSEWSIGDGGDSVR